MAIPGRNLKVSEALEKPTTFTGRNLVGDLFWPLVFLLKIFGHSPLSYVSKEEDKDQYSTENQEGSEIVQNKNGILKRGRSKSENGNGNGRESPTMVSISVLHLDGDKDTNKKDIYNCPTSEIMDHVVGLGIGSTREEGKSFHRDHLFEYKIVWKSYFLLWSATIACVYVWHWITFLNEVHREHRKGRVNVLGLISEFFASEENWETKDDSSKATMEVVSTSFKVLTHVIPITQLFELICAWTESNAFANFLNGWATFHRDFYDVFPFFNQLEQRSHVESGFQQKILKYRNIFFVIYVGIPSVFLLSALMIAGSNDWASFLVNAVFILPSGFHAFTVTLLEDVKVILAYRSLAHSFHHIRDGMAYSIKWEKLTPEKIKSWRRLVHKVRLQNALAGKSQKTHQLLLLVSSMLLVTICVFILLNGPWTADDSLKFGIICLTYALMLVGRLYMKILAAHLITHNESLVARELININTSEHNFSVQLEIKFLHDMIKQSPSCVEFGNYVTLNKKLILGIASQVVTYLIVMMQFSQSQGSTNSSNSTNSSTPHG